jgi:hypothetical protein
MSPGKSLAPRRAAQEQRQLAVGLGVAGEVVVDDEHIMAFFHEVLGHAGCGVRRDELQARRSSPEATITIAVVQRPRWRRS